MKFNIFKNKETENLNIDKSNSLTGFKNALNFANKIIKYEEKEDKIKLLDYILKTVKKDLKYSLLTEIMYKEPYKSINLSRAVIFPTNVLDRNGNEIDYVCEDKEINKKINILEDDIIVVPWNMSRKSDSIKSLSKCDFKFQENNHMGIYFEGVDFVYIHDGLHSISGGIELNKHGEIYIKRFRDIRKLYDHVHTNGLHWYSSYTGDIIEEVFDFRVAIIYEVSKLKYKIEKGE